MKLPELRDAVTELRRENEMDVRYESFDFRKGFDSALGRVLELMDGSLVAANGDAKADALEQRIEKLRQQGWELVANRKEHTEEILGTDLHQTIPALYRFEKYFRGSTLSESGEDLERAVAAAEWQEQRIAQFDNSPVPTRTGPMIPGRKPR